MPDKEPRPDELDPNRRQLPNPIDNAIADAGRLVASALDATAPGSERNKALRQAIAALTIALFAAGCADFAIRGEDSIVQGFVDGGQRWGW